MSEIRNTQQRVDKKKYDENFDAIFRKKPAATNKTEKPEDKHDPEKRD